MKRLTAVILTLCLLFTLATPVCHAYGLLDGIFGSDLSLPSLSGTFSGDTVKVKVGGVRYEVHKDFKDAMDEYEKFFDKYIKIVTAKNPDMVEYAEFVAEYAVATAAIDRVNENKLSEGDAAYFAYVQERINKKLLKVVQ